MGKASSAKRVARLAERGKGKKIRFQGGTVFPIIIAAIVVLGSLLVYYARDTSRSDALGPKIRDHWHLAYGIYICDHYLEPFQDTKESDPEYQVLQIHTHGDGVMHWHPGNEAAIGHSTGRKARFEVFLGLYGVSLSDKKLELTGAELNPPTDDQTYENGKTTCSVDGKDVKSSLRVKVWDRYDTPNDFYVDKSHLGNERILHDQAVFVVAFVPDDLPADQIPLPSWASELPTLAGNDTDPAGTATTTTTVAGETTTVAPTTTAATTTSG